jgi:hypothetical protein
VHSLQAASVSGNSKMRSSGPKVAVGPPVGEDLPDVVVRMRRGDSRSGLYSDDLLEEHGAFRSTRPLCRLAGVVNLAQRTVSVWGREMFPHRKDRFKPVERFTSTPRATLDIERTPRMLA